MRVSVERLRFGLLAGAGLLVLATAGFLGFAHFRATRFLTELPKKLGVDVRQETNSFTYSQTVKGRTVFTVHAAKAVEHNDGKYTLHDVGIVLYGQGREQPNRVDRIYGKEFEYDPNAGVIRATGEVHLDLQAPAAADAKGKMDYAAGSDLKSGRESDETAKDERLIHVTTNGLVFLRQLGVAATDDDIEFEYNGLTGHARGADYNSDSGVLVLQSAVKVNGIEQGKPAVLTATHAELDRLNHRVTLTQAKYVTAGAQVEETAAAQHVVVHTREDGSADRLEAQGAVTLTNGCGARVVGDRGDVVLSQQSRLESARLFGGVEYLDETPDRKARGESQEATAAFDGKGQLHQVVLNGKVALHERESIAQNPASQVNPLWSERELDAATVELAMAPDNKGKPELQVAKASGSARLNVVDPAREGAKPGQGSTTSTMMGDVLTAHFVRSGGVQRLSDVLADGHTFLKQVNEVGAEDTSSGDSLTVEFKDASQGRGRTGPAAGPQGGDQIASAVQVGNVVMTRRTVAKPGVAPDVQHATAQRAAYDGYTQKMTLTGGVELSDASGTLWADHGVMDRVSGDATVEDGVKASYRQSPQSEVVHVLAQRAELKKAADVAVFYGDAVRPARLWQDGSQVEAPVLEFMQKQRRLVAHGAAPGVAMAVHTVLVSGNPQSERKPPADKPQAQEVRGQGVVRIASREMTYSDEKREADFTGGVQVESKDGMMHGQQAIAYLQPATALQPAPAEKSIAKSGTVKAGQQDSLFGGSVEKVVVTGQIRMDQPGRSATGERLVYTAADGMFVLTGSPGAPPKVVDAAKGTVTGAELRFHTGDESIVISNGANNGEGPRVHTETRVKR